ncbi:MAG: hypothetical protein KME31_22750 [Tolypothrix carrinoi HA7290-LM1]|jgi:hypothetical protein|nr:hypothetical protein [Tolypothrix carrinoi HA7290-LM1]
MVIRPIGREELAAFASLSDRIDANKRFLSYLTNMWASGYIRPEWCFVAESAGKFIGRIVYWSLPSLLKPVIVDILEVPWSENYIEVGTNLLQQSLAQLHFQSGDSIDYELDSPSSDFTSLHKRIELFEHFGFSLSRETIRFEWKDIQTEIASSNRLMFRSLDQVGDDAFIRLRRKAEGRGQRAEGINYVFDSAFWLEPTGYKTPPSTRWIQSVGV